MRKFTFKKIINRNIVFIGFCLSLLCFCTSLSAQTGTWSKVTNNAPNPNFGVMLLLTDGTVICHNTAGGGYGTGWDKLTPDASGSYINGTWSSITHMINDRLFFSTQVLQNGNVYVAGGEYGPGGKHGEVYNTATNTWTLTGDPPAGWNIYDGNSEILADGTVLEGPQIGSHPSYDCLNYNPNSNFFTAVPPAPYNHDEAAWLKLPDSSILFVGIASTKSCRYIPINNNWVNDATCPVNLYDPYGEEAGCALMLPNGKAIFFGATGHNAIYNPSGNTGPGTWTVAADFPIIGGNQMGTPDASAAMMVNGHILCAVSPLGSSASNEFRSPVYFVEYNYVTNTFTQVTSILPGVGADSLANPSCFQITMLDLPDGKVLISINQDALSNEYFVYTPGSGPIPQGKPVINSIYQTSCSSYYITGKLFNGISEGAAYGDDWEMSTNYPLVRLTKGANVYYAKTSMWNRIGAVQTDSLEDTAQFVLPVGLPQGTYSLVVVANGFASSPVTFNTYQAFISASNNISCYNDSTGSATFTVMGGNPPYTFKWSPGGQTNATATNLSAGTYTVTVADKIGCTKTASVTITQPPSGLVVSMGPVVSELCNGANTGSAKVIASGGVPSYTYVWVPSGGTSANAPNLSAGTYTVTVTDASGCSAKAIATLTQPPAINIKITTTPTSCVKINGTAAATVSGGTGAYTYSWAPGGGTSASDINLTGGAYTVTVKDANGCKANASDSVAQDSSIVASVSGIDTICKGQSTTLTAFGGSTYKWSTGATTSSVNVSPASTNTYIVTAYKGTCSSNASITVVVNPTPSPVISQTGDTLYCSPAGLSYQWYINNTIIPGSVYDTLIISKAGSYKVFVTNSSGCGDTAFLKVTSLLGVNELSFDGFINVYPNPGNGELHIDCNIPKGTYTLTLTDVLGQTLYSDKLYINGTYSGIINMRGFGSGLYILTVKGHNSVSEKKVLLSK